VRGAAVQVVPTSSSPGIGRPARFPECQLPTLLRWTEGADCDLATSREVTSRLISAMPARSYMEIGVADGGR
jgi:hypothetical protein